MKTATEPCASGHHQPGLIPMVGKKYGHLTILARVRRPPGRARSAYVLVRCDCGKTYVLQAHHVRHGHVNRCSDCNLKHRAYVARAVLAVRLPSGRTYYDVSKATGVPVNTINQRCLRGWPEEDLGLPVIKKRGANRRGNVRFRDK